MSPLARRSKGFLIMPTRVGEQDRAQTANRDGIRPNSMKIGKIGHGPANRGRLILLRFDSRITSSAAGSWAVANMGLFYSNMTVYRPSRETLMSALKSMQRTAYLSPTIEGHTFIFDKAMERQNATIIEEFGTALTGQLQCAALAAVLHDDDVLYFWLFHNGAVCDRYDSLPQYFDPKAKLVRLRAAMVS